MIDELRRNIRLGRWDEGRSSGIQGSREGRSVGLAFLVVDLRGQTKLVVGGLHLDFERIEIIENARDRLNNLLILGGERRQGSQSLEEVQNLGHVLEVEAKALDGARDRVSDDRHGTSLELRFC